MQSKSLVDIVLEITAVKSKLLLTENNILTLSRRHEGLYELADYIREPVMPVRFRAEEFDEYVLSLRRAIGNIADSDDSAAIMLKHTKALLKKGHNVEGAQRVVAELIRRKDLYNHLLILDLCMKEKTEPEAVIDLLMMYGEAQNRTAFTALFRKVDLKEGLCGVRKLDELFHTEIIPSSGVIYFDQEFINYLKENNEDIHAIHWRNFERLIAEFFNKIGYVVKLGPGTSDGGVDIRVYNDKKQEKGPPLIIVQCKRYKKGNLVDINTVKAFYADVIHEDATVGLIATTSRIEAGGQEVINARGYNIAIAESKEISLMVNGMWRENYG